MNIKEIKELIEIVNNSNLTGFEYENSGVKLVLKKEVNILPQTAVINTSGQSISVNNDTVDSTELVEFSDNTFEITSPIVGTFYAAPSPDSKPYVAVGDTVNKDQTLCIVEAMKLMNEIAAEFDCEIVKILVKNEEMVQFGQPLFLVKAI